MIAIAAAPSCLSALELPASTGEPARDSAPISFFQFLDDLIEIPAAPRSTAAPRSNKNSAAPSEDQINPTNTTALPDMLSLLMRIGAFHAAPRVSPTEMAAAQRNTPAPIASTALPATDPVMTPSGLQSLIAQAPPPAAPQTAPALRSRAESKPREDASTPARGVEMAVAAANRPHWPDLQLSGSPVIKANQPISQPLTHARWDQAISQRVLWMAQDKLQSASLTLNPPQLGPLQVILQIENQQASVQFLTASAQVQQALQDAIPVLREMLGQSGIQLGQADVGSGRYSGKGTPFGTSRARAEDDRDAEISPQKGTRPVRPMFSGRGLINLFA